MPALLAEVTSDAESFVAIVFDGFDLIQPHRHVLSEALVDLRFAGGGAGGLGLLQNILRELLELIDGIGKAASVHRGPSWRVTGEFGKAVIIATLVALGDAERE